MTSPPGPSAGSPAGSPAGLPAGSPTGLPAGFAPPPYPFDRLAALADAAAGVPGGLVDLSVGTPCDPPPPAVVEALATSGTERGYPPSTGSAAFRSAAAGWLARRFGVGIAAEQVAACVGTKEFVAGVAWYLKLRAPERDTVLHPATAYPTYAFGAQLAGCRSVAVPERPAAEGGGLDLSAVSEEDAGRALLLWCNSPANPTGALTDLAAAAAWGRARSVPVLSDECYAEFTWAAPPDTVLRAGSDGVLAVHSLSKRSNLAGLRAGFVAGDPELVDYLALVRRHAGLMVPGPVQAAATVALGDDAHVAEQRQRYLWRLECLASALTAAGIPALLPAGGFYLWVPSPEWAREEAAATGSAAGWVLTEALARRVGVLASPGDFYGPSGAGFVRLAAVAPDDRIELVAERLAASELGSGAQGTAGSTAGGAGGG